MDPISYGVAAKQKQRIEKVIAEPDSTSGVITVPQVIATGETITVPAGRTAVLPNVQVDGELVVDGEVFIPSGSSYSGTEINGTIVKQNGNVVANDIDVVHKTGDETIAGIKTFSDGVKVQNQNVSPFSGFKNYIINGNFGVWQRGTSQTSNGYGSDDRWANYNIGSTKIHSQVACTDKELALFNASFFSRTIVSSVAGAGNYVAKQHNIEGVTKLAGKTVTVSFWAKADSNKNIAIEILQGFGTGGSPSALVSGIGSQLVALTSTWQKKTITINIPSIVGKTLGTDGAHTSLIGLIFWFDAGSNFDTHAASLRQQSGTFDIAQVQLEEGSVATPFEQRPYGLELMLCRRYCKNISVGAQSPLTVNCISFEPMRTAPSVQLVNYSGGTGATYSAASNDNFIYQTAAHSINALAFLRLSAEL